MRRYADLPMDLADATLVVLAERLRTPWIFTLDRRDFSVYRVGRWPAADRFSSWHSLGNCWQALVRPGILGLAG